MGRRQGKLPCFPSLPLLLIDSQFELIQKLEGHHAEIWALAVSNRGEFVVTGSHDKSIRIWEKTEEPLFLEEEREREVEALYDANIPDSLNRLDGAVDGDEAEAVQKQTAALELADADRESMREWEADRTTPKPTRNPALLVHGDLSPDEHVLRTIQKIPAASMEDALLVLPFKQVVSLLGYLDEWALNVSTSSQCV